MRLATHRKLLPVKREVNGARWHELLPGRGMPSGSSHRGSTMYCVSSGPDGIFRESSVFLRRSGNQGGLRCTSPDRKCPAQAQPQSDFGYSFEKVQELSPGFGPQRGVLLRWGAPSLQAEEGAAQSTMHPSGVGGPGTSLILTAMRVRCAGTTHRALVVGVK